MVWKKDMKKGKACTYCLYLYAISKGAGLPPPPVRTSKRYCYACTDFLCQDHEEVFHEKEEEEPVSKMRAMV